MSGLDPSVENLFYGLCAERGNKGNRMTRTFTDIEAVTKELEKAEDDLQLAAQVGQTLISNNKFLKSRTEILEGELSTANETIDQLKHELGKKFQLLELIYEDLRTENLRTENLQDDSGICAGDTSVTNSELEKLQRKVDSLEEENLDLQLEMISLTSDLENHEKKEKEIRACLVRKLDKLNQKIKMLTEELKTSTKENGYQRDKISFLHARLSHIRQRLSKLTEENADLLDQLLAAEESKKQEVAKLSFQRDKYKDMSLMLESSLNDLQRRNSRKSLSRSSDAINTESLASELLKSLSQELSQDEKSEYPMSTLELGQPGIPGSSDLQNALQSPVLRQDHDQENKEEVHSDKRSPDDMCKSGGNRPITIPETSDPVSSSTSDYSYLDCNKNTQSISQYKMSSKLQIIKPLEGSTTLQHWQKLAQPHMGGLYDRREGVNVKGERKLNPEEETYTISNFEEDFEKDEDVTCSVEDVVDGNPDQMWSAVSGDIANYPSLPIDFALSPRSKETSSLPVATSTPHTFTADGKKASSPSSYTMTLGLSAILQERDTSLACGLMNTSSSCPKISLASLDSCESVAIFPADTVAAVSHALSSQPGVVDDTGPENKEAPLSGNSNTGLVGKLISSGYSLLWDKTDAPAAPNHSGNHIGRY